MTKNKRYDVNTKGKTKGKERQWSVIMATFVAALGPLTFGYCMGYSSAATTQLERTEENMNSTELFLSPEEITWFGVRNIICEFH
jgi:hypothetical protein